MDKKKEIHTNKNINNLKKHTIMKKILFAAVAAMAITGCSQNEEIEKAVQRMPILLLGHLLMLQKLMR